MKGIALSLALGLSLACGGSRTVADGEGSSTTTPSTEPAPDPSLKAMLHISMEFEVSSSSPPTTHIMLVETNETGSNTRHDLGEFDGECKDVTPDVRATEPEVFLAFHCQPFGEQRGVLVHILNRQSRLVLLRAWLGTSKPAFDDFDQIGELPPMPAGVPLRSDYD